PLPDTAALLLKALLLPKVIAGQVLFQAGQAQPAKAGLLRPGLQGVQNPGSQALALGSSVQLQKADVQGGLLGIALYQIQSGPQPALLEKPQKQLVAGLPARGQGPGVLPAVFQGGGSVQGNAVEKGVAPI